MVDKLSIAGRSVVPVDINAFLNDHAPVMNRSAEELKKQKFSSVKEAHLVLCQMIRSYVPSLAAHIVKKREGKSTRSVLFSCSTISHNKKRTDEDCKWKAKLAWKVDGFYFTTIDSFCVHCEKCIKNRARFTPTEVDFQELFSLGREMCFLSCSCGCKASEWKM